jgi:hypothetical protein
LFVIIDRTSSTIFFVIVFSFIAEFSYYFLQLDDSWSIVDFLNIDEVIVRCFPKNEEERKLEEPCDPCDVESKQFDRELKAAFLVLSFHNQRLDEEEPYKVVYN